MLQDAVRAEDFLGAGEAGKVPPLMDQTRSRKTCMLDSSPTLTHCLTSGPFEISVSLLINLVFEENCFNLVALLLKSLHCSLN